jgi:predicted DNA-binding transcriptional regulator YafY
MDKGKPLRWDQKRRLQYIDFELYWHGEVTRRRMRELFGISNGTARADFGRYREEFKGGMSRDEQSGRYTAMPTFSDFTPRIIRPDAEAYLEFLADPNRGADLVPSANDRIEAMDTNYAELRKIEIYEPPILNRKRIDPTCLREVLRAMRGKQQIEICYRSPHVVEDQWFDIYPTALGNDGFRWACRCWRLDRHRWGEVVLDRIEEVKEPKPVDPLGFGRDEDWETVATVFLGPNPGLTESQRRAIERQYGMKDGRIGIEVRKCFLVYFLKRYQLEEPTTQKAPHQAPIVVLNRSEVTALIPPRMRVPPTE